MSTIWPFAPVFLLASILLALARQPGSPSPLACTAIAGMFFVLGVAGIGAELGWAAACGTGILFILAGLPLVSVVMALWRRFVPSGADSSLGYA